MDLILQIKLPGNTDVRKVEITNGVYVLGSQAESKRGTAIQLISPFIRQDHVLLESSRRSWSLTALQPQVFRTDRVMERLELNVPTRVQPNSKYTIGNIEIQFQIPPLQVVQENQEEKPDASLNAFTQQLHYAVTRETQLLSRIEKPDTNDPEYTAQVRKITIRLVNEALAKLTSSDLQDFAGDAARRDLIYRILGGAGVIKANEDLGISDADVQDMDRLQKRAIGLLQLELIPKTLPEDLRRLNASYNDVFTDVSKSFSRHLLIRLLAKTLCDSITDIIFGIGPLEHLQRNDDISEIMVTAHDKIFVELRGKVMETGLSFIDERAAQTIASYIVGRVGKQINVQSPYQDARLLDGSRVNAVIRPVALDGTALTIRKFGKNGLSLERLLELDCLDAAMASFLKGCVVSKKNIIVSGGTGTGKTTIVNWLASQIPPLERVVTVEDTAELRLGLPHVVRLESRPPSSEDRGEITIRDLVRNALRMRPDRIVVGECRGGEAFDMLQAMNTGHEGSMTTLHANNPTEAISRLENLVMMASEKLPSDAIRYQIAAAVDFVIQLTRYPNGKRKISAISEIGNVDSVTGRVEVNSIFVTHYDPAGPDSQAVFEFSGRTPVEIREIIKSGFKPELLGLAGNKS